jgi:hypothetical protein
MMKEEKKPSKLSAILLTCALVCSVISLTLKIIGGRTNPVHMLFQVSTVGLLIISAALTWYQYTQKYIKYEMQQKRNDEKQG